MRLHAMPPPRIAMLLLALAPACAWAQVAHGYRWVDDNGTVHYTDRTAERMPPTQSRRIPLDPDPAPIARLRLEAGDGTVLAWAENTLAGSIEVMLHADGGQVAAQPALPARATVPARGRVLVARIDTSTGHQARLRLDAVPGHPTTRPRDVEYAWPLQTTQLRIAQGWGGQFSHDGIANRHAVDFAVPVGTPVLAARDGTVMQAESGFSQAGFDDRFDARANYIRILHDDGTMAVYAHLDANGVFVRPGERVRRGQRIGLSGNTGFSSGPHLHFVLQVNRGMRLESIPFRMFGPGGVLRFREPDSDGE